MSEAMREPKAEEIIKGWEEFLKTYVPREITLEEQLAFERMKFEHEQAQKKPFVLGIIDLK